MPYVILAGAIKPERMGVYMGVFNLFIVIPQVVQSFLTPQIYNSILGNNPLNAVILGGISMLVAAVSVLVVKDIGAAKIEGTSRRQPLMSLCRRNFNTLGNFHLSCELRFWPAAIAGRF
ncbi:MAG: hypothetical protein IPP63_18870 [Chloracidobacterium sp.]|nr:hypothetical protein [Chloracidobacterium sp.]